MENNQNPSNDVVNNNPRSFVGNIRIDRANFQRRTVEGSRLLRENFFSVMEEMRPLIEQARNVNQNVISISNILNRQQPRNEGQSVPEGGDSFVINLDEFAQNSSNPQSENNLVIHIEGHNHGTDNLNNVREGTANAEQPPTNNNTEEATAAQALQHMPEARVLLDVIQKYVPFVLIFFTKALYDHCEGIFNLFLMFGCFCHANSVVKSEVSKRARRSLLILLCEVVYIIGCQFIITYIFWDDRFLSNLIMIPSYTEPLDIWNLLWIVGMTDFSLRLITILIKIFVVAVPGRIIPYQNRGKIFLFIEATSQLYRSIAPIQPWLYYLLESYEGAEKVAGVFLSSAYMVSKGSDLMNRIRLFKTSFLKVLRNVSLGTSPTKEQLQCVGGQCPICHDDYDNPVILECKHIFCEACVSTWFDREQTCPLCRAKVVDDPSWRDGSTTYFTQLF